MENISNSKYKSSKNSKTKQNRKHALLKAAAYIIAAVISIPTASYGISLYMKYSVAGKVLSPSASVTLEADCILILGAGVWYNNTVPSPMLEDRLLQGVELYNIGASQRLLMSGDHGRDEYDEVNVMKKFAIGKGIPSEHVFMDHAGFSTYESLYRAKYIFGAQKIIIVTQQYHISRALYIASHLGMEAYGVVSDPRIYAGQDYREIREILAQVKDFFYVVFKPEPTCLGTLVPISGNGDITNDK